MLKYLWRSMAPAPDTCPPCESNETPRCRFCGVKLSSAFTHDEMCASLRRHGLLRCQAAADAFSKVDRGDFVPLARLSDAYLDAAIPLGAGSQMSAPHIHASALDLLAETLPHP